MAAQAAPVETLHYGRRACPFQCSAQFAALAGAILPLDVEDQEFRRVGATGVERGGQRPLTRRIRAKGLLVGVAHQARIFALDVHSATDVSPFRYGVVEYIIPSIQTVAPQIVEENKKWQQVTESLKTLANGGGRGMEPKIGGNTVARR